MPLQDLANIWVIVSCYAGRKDERDGENCLLEYMERLPGRSGLSSHTCTPWMIIDDGISQCWRKLYESVFFFVSMTRKINSCLSSPEHVSRFEVIMFGRQVSQVNKILSKCSFRKQLKHSFLWRNGDCPHSRTLYEIGPGTETASVQWKWSLCVPSKLN